MLQPGARSCRRLYATILTYRESAERGESRDVDLWAAGLAERPDLVRKLRDSAETDALVERLTAPLRQATRRLAAPIDTARPLAYPAHSPIC